MFQPIQIEAQAEQQGLAHLCAQGSTRCASREFSFDGREQALDQGSTAVEPLRKGPPHLGTHSVHTPSFLPTFGNHALRSEAFADVGVIALAVEFRVSQHQPDTGLLGSSFDDRRQIRTVVPRTAPRELGQHELLIQIHGDHPLQPVPPRQRFLPVMMHAPHKERARRSLRQARGVHGNASTLAFLAQRTAQPAHRFANRAVDGLVVETLQKTIQCREVGHTHKAQHLAQFAMLAQPHLGFTKGPVFVTHQAENGQQLRLGKLTFAETASVTREHRPGDLKSDAGKRQESNFGHRTSCLHRKPRKRLIALPNFNEVARMSTEPPYQWFQYGTGMPQWRGCGVAARVPKKEKTDCKGDGSPKPLHSGGLRAYTKMRMSLPVIWPALLNEGYRDVVVQQFVDSAEAGHGYLLHESSRSEHRLRGIRILREGELSCVHGERTLGGC